MTAMDELSPELGRKLRQLRQARGKSLAVVAGRAGISAGHLSRLEHGQRALDRRSLIIKLAEALDVAPSEITGASLTVPGERDDDRALSDVRMALFAVGMGEPRGEVQPVDQLSTHVHQVVAAENDCRTATVGAALPSLIRDLHTTARAAQSDQQELLRLLTLAHMQGTQAWLTQIGAPLDLSWQAALLARDAAERLDEPTSHAISAFGTSLGLLSAGALDLAGRTLNTFTMPTDTPEDMQLNGMLALSASLIAAARGDSAERKAALEHAAELADRTGETNRLGFGFGPSNVAVWRMQGALEAGEYAEAARIAEAADPQELTVRARRAVYWREYGRALARLPRQQAAAVRMLRRAEQISPEHVHRHPFTRSLLAELIVKAKRDAVGRELRGMAYRAGLPV
jgi:transcriptional regulator with XRE-family HTH domain